MPAADASLLDERHRHYGRFFQFDAKDGDENRARWVHYAARWCRVDLLAYLIQVRQFIIPFQVRNTSCNFRFCCPNPSCNFRFCCPNPLLNFRFCCPNPLLNFRFCCPNPLLNFRFCCPNPLLNFRFCCPNPLLNFRFCCPNPLLNFQLCCSNVDPANVSTFISCL